MSVKDTDGGESQISEFTLDIEDFIPVADFTISNSNDTYTLDASNSTDDYEISSYEFKVTSPDLVETIYNQKIVSNLLLSRDGEWKFSLIVKDNKNQASAQFIKSEFVDRLPPDPGEAGKVTLAGIDSDSDGVRDDVEREIASMNVSNESKIKLKDYSKNLQFGILNSDITEVSIQNTYDLISQEYCMKSTMSDDQYSNLKADLMVKQYNTKKRLLAWARTEANFSGKTIYTDTDEINYIKYCK